MNFIKKVIGGVTVGAKLKSDDINSTQPCVPPKCDYVSKEITRSALSMIKDYESANYYNYFRNLERKSVTNSQVGLKSTNVSAPGSFVLDEFNIESEMTDSCVISVWTQKYTNKYQQPVESNYQIPLAPYSTVSDFTVTLKDKVLKGKIKENSKAKEKYSDAIASGGQAFLAEKTSDGFFKLQIGNLPPNEQVTISITIISEIGTHLESFHYCIHRLVFPSYSFKFNYKLNISLSTPIESIDLDHFTPTITYLDESKTKATLTISDDKCVVMKNIIAIIIPKYSDKPESFIEYSSADTTYAVALNFYPNFGVDPDMVDQKSEFIFVIDCSGSMSGEPIKKSKSALEICMRSLNENSKFNIVCFGSSFEKMFKSGSKFYNDESLEEASGYIDRIDANLGGTELYEPIVNILSEPYDPEYPRQVFILTDGEIDNRDKLVEYVAKEANTTRIFTFGIGSYVDKELVIGLSKACKGYFELIKENKDMEEQVMKLISIAMQPTLSNIRVDWGGLKVVQSPSQIRPLFNQERMMIYATLEKEPSDKLVTVNVIGNGPLSTPISFPVTLDFKKSDSKSDSIHSLSAFKCIQDLEESERKEKKDHKDLIVKLGKKYGLVSKHTSYIVTAESENATQETMKTVEVLESNNNNINSNNNNNNIRSRNTGSASIFSSNIQLSAPSPVFSSQTTTPPSLQQQQFYPSKACIVQSDAEIDTLYAELNVSAQFDEDLAEEEECDYKMAECSQPTVSSCPPPVSACPPPPPCFTAPPTSLGKISYNSSVCPPPPPSYQSSACPPPPAPGGGYYGSPILSKPTITSSSSSVVDIVRSQKANGSFNRSNIPSSIKVETAPTNLASLDEVWVTLFIIATFMVKFDSQKAQWELVVQKASKFVKQQLLKSNISTKFEDLLESAKVLIK